VSDKSPQKANAKQGKTLKEKRAAKLAKAAQKIAKPLDLPRS